MSKLPVSVLDSFALIAYFRNEPGADTVEKLLINAIKAAKPLLMCEVNYAEAKYMILRKHGKPAWESAASIRNSLPIEFHSADRTLSDMAAQFKSKHRISLADAFAAALAKSRRAYLVTGNPEFTVLEKELKITWLK